MKNLIFFATSLVLVSCASMSFDSLWSADSVGKLNCEQVVLDKHIQSVINNQTDEEMTESMKKVGYSECSFTRNESGLLTVCQKPILYKTLLTKNMAECHKFLQENKSK